MLMKGGSFSRSGPQAPFAVIDFSLSPHHAKAHVAPLLRPLAAPVLHGGITGEVHRVKFRREWLRKGFLGSDDGIETIFGPALAALMD
jgi:hypothetical protein